MEEIVTNKDLKDILEKASDTVEVKVVKAILKTPEQKRAEEEFEDWKNTKNKDYEILKEFDIANNLLRVVLGSDEYNGLVFEGEGGIGKSVLTINSIKNTLKPNEWAYFSGYTTPLSLYEFLYHNREKKAIIFDDSEGLFSNRIALSIFKGCLWDNDGKRIVQYSSKSDKAQLPQRFIMKAKVLVLCNEIPKREHISTRALLSRTIQYNLQFSFEEKMIICERFLNNEKNLSTQQKDDIRELLSSEVTPYTKDFNFRTLRKIIAFVKYSPSKARELFLSVTEEDEQLKAYYNSVTITDIISEQVKKFRELCGGTRYRFYEIKKQLKARKKI